MAPLNSKALPGSGTGIMARSLPMPGRRANAAVGLSARQVGSISNLGSMKAQDPVPLTAAPAVAVIDTVPMPRPAASVGAMKVPVMVP